MSEFGKFVSDVGGEYTPEAPSFGPSEVGSEDGVRPHEVKSLLREEIMEWSVGQLKLGSELTGADGGMLWVYTYIAHPTLNADDALEQKRRLNTQITYICEAAAASSGRTPWYHAGVPKNTFRAWQKNRDFFYWPPNDIAEAIEQRMALDGYTRGPGRREQDDLLGNIAEFAMAIYRVYRIAALAHGFAHPG